jgi:hypothetical protein
MSAEKSAAPPASGGASSNANKAAVSVEVTSFTTNYAKGVCSWHGRESSALPFWAGCGLLLSSFPLFFVPAWDQYLYFGNLGLSYAE